MPARKDTRSNHRRPNRNSRDQAFWIYGLHAVAAALSNPKRIVTQVLVTEDARRHLDKTERVDLVGLPVSVVRRADVTRATPDGAAHQGMAAAVLPLPPIDLDVLADAVGQDGDRPALIVVIDQVTDPQNVGAIIRCASVFGARAVIAPAHNAARESGALAKAASGALDCVPIVHVPNLARTMRRLAEFGYWRIGLDHMATRDLIASKIAGPMALVLGAEGKGLRRLTRETCDDLAHIESFGALDTLNVAAATAVALYELRRGTGP